MSTSSNTWELVKVGYGVFPPVHNSQSKIPRRKRNKNGTIEPPCSSHQQVTNVTTCWSIFNAMHKNYIDSFSSLFHRSSSKEVGNESIWCLPYDHTSDLLLNLACVMTSGAAHFMGNFVPSDAVYSSSTTNLASPKSATFTLFLSPTKQLRAACVCACVCVCLQVYIFVHQDSNRKLLLRVHTEQNSASHVSLEMISCCCFEILLGERRFPT